MALDSVAAARAYLDTARAIANGQTEDVKPTQDAGFGNLLNQAVSAASGAGQTVETAMAQAATGRADLVDVVTAVAAAEATLETVVAVRDQVIKAYQDILRMPI
ncbi:MAG: flagellar hook-basal body complex protein FliE [Ponticaulis sp.]|nr:flagellar hook-basal body complex protein FliE [Ponticaulis sp.]